jgi:hypothetical protein
MPIRPIKPGPKSQTAARIGTVAGALLYEKEVFPILNSKKFTGEGLSSSHELPL